MLEDIMKESWVYQEKMQLAEERGLAKGLEKGLEEGLATGLEKALQSHRQAIVDIVSKRFPLLSQLSSQQVAHMTDLDALRILVVNISIADNVEAARRELIDAVKS